MQESIGTISGLAAVVRARRSFAQAHWHFVAVLAITVAGFWPTFFSRLTQVDVPHLVHGASATGWIVVLALQSWLMSKRRIVAHRRVAWFALGIVLPTMVASALYMTGIMQRSATLPSELPPFFAVLDFAAMSTLAVLITLALRSLRSPGAHKRYMAATVFVGLPAAFTRLCINVLAPPLHPAVAFHLGLALLAASCVVILVVDRRSGARYLAWPIVLTFLVAVLLFIGPISASPPWRAAMVWYGALAIFR